DVLGLLVARLAHRDADRRGADDLLVLDLDGFLEGGLDALGDVDGVLGVLDVFEEDGELVAAEAGDGVAGSHRELEAPRGLDEQGVAGAVAHAVVDELEAIEVEEEDAEEAVLLAPRVADAVAQAVDEERAVGQ